LILHRPAIIFDDAELDNAVANTAGGFLRNSGQVCFASSRILVQEGIQEQYVEKVKKAMEDAEKQMGDPSDPKTMYGPVADKKQFDRVMGFLQGAREEGVQVLVGGERQGDKGTFVKPTVFLNPDLKSKVYTDEIFGPVISVRTFKDEEEAIKLANDTTYGLGCKCFPTGYVTLSLTQINYSNRLHRRHCPRSPRGRQDRSRHRRHQLRLQHLPSNSIWWIQAERYWP
jgi:acyl-CoA reductase-like NAD-dependent aldehyde dehydrogenase